MASSTLFLFFSITLSLFSPSQSQTCTSQTFTNNKRYDRCTDLPQLSSYLHWTYDSSESSISVAFIAPPPSSGGWISWAINPVAVGMVGAQALIAFRQSNGLMAVMTYNISSYASVQESELAFDVTEKSAEYSEGMMKIFATIVLPGKGKTKWNQVWQVGHSVMGGVPAKHDFQPANLNSQGTLDLLTGQSTSSAGGDDRVNERNIHGVMNIVSWGVMFPIGIITARYLRTFEAADPAWFYLHVFCQVSSYVIGVAGWGTGLKLGAESVGVQYTDHRNIGIALFCLANLQIFGLFLRPKKDHKFRIYWNLYHHGVGYSVLILGIFNVFRGLAILHPPKIWKTAYIGVLAVLAMVALCLEAITRIVVMRKKRSTAAKPYDRFSTTTT